jgi:L-ascorbate metabolism protein UlaG (beta-lactamase superfamily)
MSRSAFERRVLAALAGTAVVLGCAPRLVPHAVPDQAPPLPGWLKPGKANAPVGPHELRVSWLGTAGLEVRSARGALVIDPFFSRQPLLTLLGGPLRPDEAAIARHMAPVDAVLVGHAHYDHFADAPTVARRAGARLWASPAALRLAAQEGLPAAQRCALTPHVRFTVADMEVEAVPSQHSPMPTQWLTGGNLMGEPRLPLGFLSYKNDEVYSFAIRWRGRTVYHCGSANTDEGAIGPVRADLVFACVSGWRSCPDVFGRLVRSLRARVLAPFHHDDFFRPFSDGVIENPLAFHDEALRTMRRDAPDAAILPLRFFDDHRLEALP